jgi:DNA-binding response OmpR family regulator
MMTVLIADDEESSRKLVRAILKSTGYALIEASNGQETLTLLQKSTTPIVGLIDWEMPELDGLEVCRQARLASDLPPLFLILLTVRDSLQDVVAGLQSGANDYVTKPFDHTELLARVNVGARLVELQQALIDQARELRDALAQFRQLSGLLPICSYCKKIRDDKNYWQQVESYVSEHTDAQFSQGICPECYNLHILSEHDQSKIKTDLGEAS